MGKEVKTNAMRILDRNKIPYEIINYECDEFIDGLHTAEKTGAPVEQSFKTLVMSGKAAPAGTDSIMFCRTDRRGSRSESSSKMCR